MSQASYPAAQVNDAPARARTQLSRPRRRAAKRGFGTQIWTLLHACSLLSGPGSQSAHAAIEDDYQRMARRPG